MWALAFMLLVKETISSHIYEKNGQTYLQIEGLPIGNIISGEISETVMTQWDREFIETTNRLNIPVDMYGRYVDDEGVVTREIKPGVRFNGKQLIHNQELEELDNMRPGDIRTMDLLRTVGDSIMDCIKLEADAPSNYSDNKIPMLDIKIWTDDNQRQLWWKFFKKDMANKMTVHRRSALSYKEKTHTMWNECLRRLRNTHYDLPDKVRHNHLTEYSKSMKLSEWKQEDRYATIKGALELYSGEVEKHRKGGKTYL